ncbi:MAG: hypothetical protein ACYSVY_22280 [Planctomycetota bacterium]|jgi:hypothetical protein
MSKAPAIRFENAVQVALYKCEISGQLSDGHWENASPHDHWEIMHDAWIGVESEQFPAGCNFRPRRRYNFASPELLDVIGQRMLHYARLANAGIGVELIEAIDNTLFDLDGEIRTEIRDDLTGDYWDQKRTQLKLFDPEAVRAIITDESYTMADMRSDLRSMSQIVNSGRNSAVAQ